MYLTSRVKQAPQSTAFPYTAVIPTHKYTDVNGNGVVDTGDTGLANVTIFIDKNGNGSYDAGTDQATTTDANGFWTFTWHDPTVDADKVSEVLARVHLQNKSTAGDTT